MEFMRLIACVCAVLAAAPTASAQSAELPRAFIGGGVSFATGDAEDRMGLFDETPPWVAVIEGGVRLAPRVGIGAEVVQPADLEAVTRGQSFQSWGEQRERAVIGTARVRLAGNDRIALDAAGGAGVLFQHHELQFFPCFTGCEAASTETMTSNAPAFLIGGDVPIQLARHFVVAATGRVYFFNRGNHVTEDPRDPLPWQFEWRSSQRFALGVTARAVW